jgi:hypothetical protein
MKPISKAFVILTSCVVAVGAALLGPLGVTVNPVQAGATVPILSATYQGGFVPIGADFRAGPSYLLVPDRTLYVPAPITLQYPGPSLRTFSTRKLSQKELARVDKAATAAGLKQRGTDFGVPNTADVPELVIGYRGQTHRILSFGVGEESLSTAQRARRTAVAKLLASLNGGTPASAIYRPQSLAVLVTGTGTPPTDTGVTIGVVDWPTEAGPLSVDPKCRVLSGPAAQAARQLLESTNELTRYRSNGETYELAVRVMLPLDRGC